MSSAKRLTRDEASLRAILRIGPVLTLLIAMALLAGRREIAEIARFARALAPARNAAAWVCRLKKGTRAFYERSRLRGVLSGCSPAWAPKPLPRS